MRMKALPTCLILLGSFVLAPTAPAQTPEPARTPAAVVKPPADPSRWRIDFEYPDQKNQTPAAPTIILPFSRPASLEVTISGGKAQLVRSEAGKEKETLYLEGALCYFTSHGAPVVRDVDPENREQRALKVYPGTEGFTQKDYVGTTNAYGQSCRYYKRTLSAPEGEAPTFAELWVSEATGLPAGFRLPAFSARYIFFDRPTAAVQIPAEYTALAAASPQGPGTAGAQPSPRKKDAPPQTIRR